MRQVLVQMWELRQPVLPRLRTPRACLPCPPPPSPSPCARLPQVAPDDVAACSSGLKATEAQRAYPQLFAMSGSAPPIRSAAIVAVSQWDVAMCSAGNLPHAPVAPSRAPPSSGAADLCHPVGSVFRDTAALARSRHSTALVLPLSAARCRGVHPFLCNGGRKLLSVADRLLCTL